MPVMNCARQYRSFGERSNCFWMTPPSDAATLRRLLRLDRGVRELTELLEVLLGLVRGHELQIGQRCREFFAHLYRSMDAFG